MLEVVRHVNIGSDLVRPTTERICGRRSVVAYFKHNPESGRLASGALKLLESEGQGQRIYSALGEEWVPSSAPPPRDPGGYSDFPPAPGVQYQLIQLEAQLLGLSAVQQGLVARLERLEERLAVRASQAREPSSVERARAAALAPGANHPREPALLAAPRSGGAQGESPRGEGSLGGPAAGAAAASSHGAAAAPHGGVASPHGAAAAPHGAASPAHSPAKEVLEGLRIPPLGELAKCIALLIGNNVSAEEASPFTINKMTRDCYAAPLQDDRGEHVGLIVMDMKATIYLGGTLMMLPQSQLEQQVKLAAPEEDSIAASAEVCNALAGPINACQPHRHVRVGAFEKFEFKSFSWTSEPALRCDLADSFGGRIAILTRSFAAT
ncbi:MAG: hypothetical protein RL685_5109 [Pseudomonadota bacterium]